LLIILKLLTISSKYGLRSSACQHIIVQLLIWNEKWHQYSCASVDWTKRQWSTKPHWFRWVFLAVSGGSRMTC